ncbi:spermatogenesis-associated protein 7 isoform X1 [Dipodomys spectabilis]|uniref:spermatogenesis-associated protein 7 isoform X1 n=1 Tax=Dipodomys spectabilis TaxID=105255 RepID=UPI001C54628B|nr:spermatogenesis-associated protein 7 isoform X1 [Dipodomys spectabilis]
MDGSRRVRTTPVLPRYCPPCIFKGHLSTKSNAFCTDSSSLRLTTLQLVKNHMAVHYNKILSAKAAVDCSVPISVNTSIKYADQQRREKLKKELARWEKELKLAKTAMQAHSKINAKSFFNTLQKPSGELQDQDVLLEVNEFEKSVVPSPETLHLNLPKSDKVFMIGDEKNSSSCPPSLDYLPAAPRKSRYGTMNGRRPRNTLPNAHRFQLVISKAPSGDLLEKHSDLFSNKELPFTPRTLKTDAKSFLSQYRYYTPAKRKKECSDQRTEAETQTELSSFNSDLETSETKNWPELEVNTKQASNSTINGSERQIIPLPFQGHSVTWDKIKDATLQHPSQQTVCQYSIQLPPKNKHYSDEEELLYLSFIEDVTDEILRIGVFSNRFLERLFERHIKENKHHLEEGKMRHLLQGLKIDLGCLCEENSDKLNEVDRLNVLDLSKAMNSKQNELKHETDIAFQQEYRQYQKALDLLLSAPKNENEMFSSPGEFIMPPYKPKYSENVTVQQVSDESNLGPATWGENHPGISDHLIDHQTSVHVIEGDNDTEKAENSSELYSRSTLLSPSGQVSGIKGDNNHDKELPTHQIMEMSIEDCALDI